MRTTVQLTLLTLCLLPAPGRGDEKPDPLEARKTAALENWGKIEGGQVAVETPDGQQDAWLMRQRKAEGASTIPPYWLVNGLGRATYYRVIPSNPAVKNERALTSNLVRTKKRTAQDVWNATLDGEDPALM